MCIFDDADGLDGFFLLGNAKFGFDAAAGDVGELTCSFFFFFGGFGDSGLATSQGKQTITFDVLGLDLDHTLTVQAGNRDLTIFVFTGDADALLGSDPCRLGLLALSLFDLGSRRISGGLHGADLLLLTSLGFGTIAFHFEDGLVSVDGATGGLFALELLGPCWSRCVG